MSSNPRQLIVEFEHGREKTCKIVGTREGLLLLGKDLTTAAQELPEPMTRSHFVHLPGWEQHTLHVSEDGVVFEAQPAIEAYLSQRRSSRSRILPWLQTVFGVLLVGLALIGLRTLWLWIF
jgi:hypothetical protein